MSEPALSHWQGRSAGGGKGVNKCPEGLQIDGSKSDAGWERLVGNGSRVPVAKFNTTCACTAGVHPYPDGLTFKDTRVDHSLLLRCEAVWVYVSLKGPGERQSGPQSQGPGARAPRQSGLLIGQSPHTVAIVLKSVGKRVPKSPRK